MATIAQHLESACVPIEDLNENYGPMLALVEELIGVVPDCDSYLEIWPPGFRTYNLCVPNLLNLPNTIVSRSELKAHMGLAMYVSSRTAGCPYCAAHTSSFALRRGASESALDGSRRTPVQQAIVALAVGMASEPSSWDRDCVEELGLYLSADDIEWIALSVANMGFLNKFMDAISVPLELDAINDVAHILEPDGWEIGKAGWRHGTATRTPAKVPTDSASVYGRIIRHGPKATLIERNWTKHLPTSTPELRAYLREERNVDVPVLSRIRHTKAVGGIAAMLDQNLNPTTTDVGLDAKALAGLVYASTVDNGSLIKMNTELAAANGVSETAIDSAIAAGADPSYLLTDNPASVGPEATEHTNAVVRFAHAISPSPTAVSDELAAATSETLDAGEIVEIAVWVSVLQLLHRIERFTS